MPYDLKGFGTRYYGKSEVRSDGTYITTEWVTAFYIPLFPLGSYRVLPTGNRSLLARKVPICWRHVGNVYFVVGLVVLAIVYFEWPSIRGRFR